MAVNPKPATTLRERNRWLSYALEQDGKASALEHAMAQGSQHDWTAAIATHRESAKKYREAAAAYKPVIEGDA